MNLDFGILWIEDSYSKDEEGNLRRRIMDAGFIARIEVVQNGENIHELARTHNLYHRFDLILLDYRLKNAKGDELAPAVRELFPSTSILFYSGSLEEQELRELIARKQVEGVFCSARQRFIERTGSLIEQTARALDRLSGMRGLAMKVVAECDTIMKQTMLSMCARDPQCVEKMSELDRDVFLFMDEMKSSYEQAILGNLDARLATRAVDSAKLFKHFRRLTQVATSNPQAFGMDQDRVEKLRELRSSSADYISSVLVKRNVLGHVVEVAAENGWMLQGSHEITTADFPELRRTFARYVDAFREMSEIVTDLDKH